MDQIIMRRVDPVKNLSRFYTLSVQPTLFGELVLVRNWGRMGRNGRCGGRIMRQTFTSPSATATEIQRLIREKQLKGYATTA